MRRIVWVLAYLNAGAAGLQLGRVAFDRSPIAIGLAQVAAWGVLTYCMHERAKRLDARGPRR